MDKKVKIMIADDHPVYRDGLFHALRGHSSVAMIGQASHGLEVLQMLENAKYDVVLMDIQMKEMNGLECTTRIRREFPEVKVIALSMFDDGRHLVDMMEKGADGYLVKNADKEEIIEAIESVMKGNKYFSEAIDKEVLKLVLDQKPKTGKRTSRLDSHEERLREIIYLICKEKTSKEIGEILFLSSRTVEDYRREIAEMTGARNLAGVIQYAFTHGIDRDEILLARFKNKV